MGQDGQTLSDDAPGSARDGVQGGPLVRGHRRRSLMPWVGITVLYAIGILVAHLLKAWLPLLTFGAYAVADVGGLAFVLRYVHTDWRSHAWGRHVMAFMICLEIIFTLTVSRLLFGNWTGLRETLFLASCTFTGIVWWRYALQAQGDRRARQLRTTLRYGAAGRPDAEPRPAIDPDQP